MVMHQLPYLQLCTGRMTETRIKAVLIENVSNSLVSSMDPWKSTHLSAAKIPCTGRPSTASERSFVAASKVLSS
jgi:hypothetical protein